MKIYYGVINYILIDVTNICMEKLANGNIITIPSGDYSRAIYFSDPLVGIKKNIIIENNGTFTDYDELTEIKIDMSTGMIDEITNRINNKLAYLHSKLKIKYGNLNEEVPEQKMSIRYLTGSENVLEIGGNIGRNSLIIASILKNSNNLVTLESDINIARQLTENRDLNNLHFHIECSALSNRKLIQRGWDTIPSEILLEGYNWVNTISLENLKKKYNIAFDTLVLDCEGAFYYILMDMPEILNGINLIIMENDYFDETKKKYVDEILKKNDFIRDYVESLGNHNVIGYYNFFEVWKRV